MEKIALLFPGQGSQFVGMGKILANESSEAKAIFDQAEALAPGLRSLCFEGPEETLRLTVNAQPAIFTVSMASYEAFKKLGHSIAFAAGHSVGEYGALAAAGVLPFKEAFLLVKKRGELMYQEGTKRPGTMAAILGLDSKTLLSICAEVTRDKIVEVANLNSPTQAVISGDPEAVRQAGDLAKARGAKRVLPLPVSGAFHSKLMEEAATKLGDELDRVPFKNAQFPVVANLTGRPSIEGSEIRELLKKQIRGQVLWEESIRNILSQGVSTFVEMEPGTILSGLVRSIDKNAKTLKLEELLGLARSL